MDAHMELPSERGGAPAPARRLLWASFGLTFVLVLLAFAVEGVVPFGDSTLLFSDCGTQYLSFWSYFRQVFLGRQDLFYALEKNMGGNVLGLFAYYGASPLNLLFLLFPQEKLPLAFSLIVLLKLSGCALTMALFFRGTGGLRRRDLLLTAAYALCAYNISYFWSAMWLDGVLLLPLVALGLRRIFEGGRARLYLFSLAGAIVFNYYTGYMLCVFSALYALLLFFDRAESARKLPWREAGRFILASLAAGGSAAFMLLPALLSMEGGKVRPFRELFSWYTYSTALKILGWLLPGREAEYDGLVKYVLLALLLTGLVLAALALALLRAKKVRPWVKGAYCAALVLLMLAYAGALEEGKPFLHKLLVGFSGFYEIMGGLPNIWTGLLPLALGLLYFMDRRVPGPRRAASLAFLLVLLFSMGLYVPNLIWHGFTENNSFNFRYSFVFSFFLLSLARESLRDLEALRLRQGLSVLAIAALLIALARNSTPVLAGDGYYAAAFLALGGFCAGLALFPRLRGKGRAALWAVVAAVHLLSLTAPLCVNLANLEDFFHTSYAAYQNTVRTVEENRAAAGIGRGELFRARLGGGINGPMMYGYPGLSHFSSTERQETLRFMNRMGISVNQAAWANADSGTTRAFDSLMGVRMFTGGAYVGDLEPLDGTRVYENPTALPLAFLSVGGAAGYTYTGDPFEHLNSVYRALCPGLDLDVFTPAEEITLLEDAGQTAAGSAARVDYSVRTGSADPLYLFVPCDASHPVEIWFNGEYLATVSNGYDGRVFCLGAFAPGEAQQLSLRSAPEDPMLPKMDTPLLYTESSAALAAYKEALSSPSVTVESGTDSRFVFRCAPDAPGESLVFTVPWEKGWQVTVDGEPAEAGQTLGLFLTVPLDPGEHTVQLRFVPPGLTAGLAVSGLTLAILAAAALAGRRKRRKKI